MDIYTEHHPHHEIGPIEHLKYVGAQYYTTLLSRLTSHIKNEDVHVSNADKVKWEKAFLDINDLKNKVDSLTPSSNKDDIDLSTYATHTWVDENFARKGYYPTYEDLSSRYALKTDIPSVADFATKVKVYVDNAIANIKPGSSTDMSGYATKQDVETLDDFVESAVNGLQDQINNIGRFTLSPASNKELGGIKTGSTPGGNGDYPVLMNGEFAYVHIPISSTSEDVVITSMYSIHPIMSDVKISDNGVLQGSVTWSVAKHEGQSSSTVIFPSQDVTTYAVLLPQNERLEMLPFGRGGSEEVTAVCEWADGDRTSGDFIQIFVKKDTTIVATSTIPVIKTGKNGKDGTTTIEYQSLSFPVVRLCGEYVLGTTYYSGDTTVNGVAYIDIVSYEGALYKAAKTGLNSAPMAVQGEWEPFSIYGQNAFYNLLVANQAFITALASKQIVVVDNEGKPVAGLLSNDATITTEDPNTHETKTYNRSRVRIFAGANNGNVAEAPFRVYDDGRLVANNAEIKGYINATDGIFSGKVIINNTSIVLNTDGSGQVANGNIWWDANGNITIKGATIINSKIVSDSGKKDYQDMSDTIIVTFESTPIYNNGVVSNIKLRVVNDTQFQGQVKIQVGFDGVHGDWSAQSETEWFQVAERTTHIITVPDATAYGNVSADMDLNSPVITSVIGIEDNNV